LKKYKYEIYIQNYDKLCFSINYQFVYCIRVYVLQKSIGCFKNVIKNNIDTNIFSIIIIIYIVTMSHPHGVPNIPQYPNNLPESLLEILSNHPQSIANIIQFITDCQPPSKNIINT